MRTLDFKIKPRPGKRITEEAAQINGYSEEAWAYAREPRDAMVAFVANLGPVYWAGSNPTFDRDFIEVALGEAGLQMPELASRHLLDVGSMCWPLVTMGLIDSVKQRKVAELLGLGEQSHRAHGDVMQMIDIYRTVIGPLRTGASAIRIRP